MRPAVRRPGQRAQLRHKLITSSNVIRQPASWRPQRSAVHWGVSPKVRASARRTERICGQRGAPESPACDLGLGGGAEELLQVLTGDEPPPADFDK